MTTLDALGALVPLRAQVLANVLQDLSIEVSATRTLGEPRAAEGARARHALVGVPAGPFDPARVGADARAFAAEATSADGVLLVATEGQRADAELARVRNALWPDWHVVALYRTRHRQITKSTLSGPSEVGRGAGFQGHVLTARRRAFVLAPENTVSKFDQNAAAWNGLPGSAGYAHFRWMRAFVAEFAANTRARRILDFGCGAGWVGIEAARRAPPGATLAAFDPSPEMVRLAEDNARSSGVTAFEGRVGFGEDPPFPAAGEARFDLVFSSGVISFSGEPERWLDGLARTIDRQGTLVLGDVNRTSRGMQRRRAEKPLLPVREMNAATREEARAALERRGFTFEAWSGYQLSDPVPQIMHWSERRLAGFLHRPCLAWNRRAAARSARTAGAGQERFDSWVMRCRAP